MQTDNLAPFVWPVISNTASIVAIVLAAAIVVFGVFSGARANKVRLLFAVCLSTAIGWFAMPLVAKFALALHIMNTKTGVMILITAMMLFAAALATIIYEIIIVTLSDIGMASKR